MASKDWKRQKFYTFGLGWESKANPEKEIYILNESAFGSPNMGLWYVYITRRPKKWFKTKTEAIAYARKYMKTHR